MASRDWQYSKRLALRCYLVVFVATGLIGLHVIRVVYAATVPAGFTDTLVVNGLVNPTAMEFAPDGRLFVCEQGGTLRVIKNGALLSTPFLSVTVNSSGERGLLGVAFDPNFAINQFVYIYYTATTPTIHNRISRFTASGDVAVPGSGTIIFELDNLSSATNHNGGAIHFGLDGSLYVAVGDNANGNNAQSLSTVHGKMLRLSPDGGIPSDNPFFNQTTGNNRAIWALGLRNPFTFSIQPGTGRMFINDVGQNTTEEINDGIAGSNYGWPTCEGNCNPPNSNFRNPIYTYLNDPSTCAITGGAFYNPQTVQFPSTYLGNYFFADFCGGWIRNLDPANGNAVVGFATGTSLPVDLKVSADGSLYYLARGTGAVHKIQYPANMQPPTIASHPQNQTVAVGQSAPFSVSATGTPPFSYQWQRNGSNIGGETSSTYTLSSAQLSDNGAMFRAVVTNSFGSATSNSAQLSVTPPSDTIWVDDSVPTGAVLAGDGGDGWNWISTNPNPFSGNSASQSNTFSGEHQHYFYGATDRLTINSGDSLIAYVYLDPANTPSEVMLQWNDGDWDQRAYWGANNIPWGTNGTNSLRSMGALPAAGQWVRLEVPASLVGLEGHTLNGLALTLYGGRATWDAVGKSSTGGAPTPTPTPTPSPAPPGIWVEDAVPAGAVLAADGGDSWNWIGANPTPFSGNLANQSNVGSGEHQHYFFGATETLTVNTGESLIAYIYIDPGNVPSEIMLQWNVNGSWDHRAYWGANLINWGTDGTNGLRFMGPIPATGQWIKLEVPASLVGLENTTLNGMAFTLFGGRATWDSAGKSSGSIPTPTPTPTPTPSPAPPGIWVEDAVPTGATLAADGGDSWNWIGSNPTPFSGNSASQSNISSGEHQHYFVGATDTLMVNTGDTLIAYVYIDPANPPSEIMLQWHANGSWDHRAYWGANNINWGTNGTNSLRFIGALPATGVWVRLQVPASSVGLEGTTVNGMAFTLFGGRATWDSAGKAVP